MCNHHHHPTSNAQKHWSMLCCFEHAKTTQCSFIHFSLTLLQIVLITSHTLEAAATTATRSELEHNDLLAAITANGPESPRQAECGVISDVGKNYLTPIDIVVKNEENSVACIRARFALSIKVEEDFHIGAQQQSSDAANSDTQLDDNKPKGHRTVLGYLPLENVLKVDDTCPGETTPTNTETPQDTNSTLPPKTLDELEMIVTFECGKMQFTFRRDENKYFMSSLRGQVKLDEKVRREFIANKPMFLTSDLKHRFKYDDLIEIGSEMQTKAYILSANFYSTEIEVFRETASRDFTRPPDTGSKPFAEN